ncbi:ESPR-type extended signal peptide-containing protein [Stenotrophomonas sp.]|uniref:ESPR-type extended signal peptide-containing protein n=1 Tax=Stenotrophomonas sp. TaxID=69392 RepID=UPI0028B1232B|nr:ESPR-type extended signal peptide-containing protein [Stenotrophomonas sp.]
MNKIYRRLWSTARQCWVVASELTAARGKASTTVRTGALLVAGLVLAPSAFADDDQAKDELTEAQASALIARVFGSVASMPTGIGTRAVNVNGNYVQNAIVSDTFYRDSTISGNHLLILGSRSALSGSQSVAYGNLINSSGDNNTAIGYKVQISKGYSTGIGAEAVASGVGTTALGNNAKAYAHNSIAVGSGSRTNDGAGISRIAIGGDAYAGTSGYTGAVALGGRANASHDSVAIGYEARTTTNQSVALGRGSVANEAYTVSVGKAGDTRRIVNVKDGRLASGSSDAVTGHQLFATNTEVGKAKTAAASAQTTANTANTTANTARTTANTAKTAADAATARLNAAALALGSAASAEGSGTSASTALGSAAKAYNTNGVAVGADARAGVDVNGNKVSTSTGGVALGAGSRSGNGAVASGLRAIATGDRAVAIGSDAQAKNIHATALGYKATANANQATAIGRESSASGTYASALGNLAKATAESSVAIGNGAVVSHVGSVALGSGAVTTGVNQVSVGNGTTRRTITHVADGALGANSTDAVTGKQLYDTNVDVAAVRSTANAAQTAAAGAKTTADSALSKANALGGLVSQVSATGNVRLGGENTGTVVDVANKSGAKRRVNNVANGTLSSTSTDVVTGQQLHATNQSLSTQGQSLVLHDQQLATHTQTLAAQDVRVSVNRSDIDKLRADVDNFDPDLDGVVKFASDGSVDVGGGVVRNVAAGDISSAASTDAVNGGQLFATNAAVVALEESSKFMTVGGAGDQEAARAGLVGVALGDSARASPNSEGGVAVGSYSSALGKNSVALGRAAYVSETSDRGFALGVNSSVRAAEGVALGAASEVEAGAVNAVAVGANSIATESATVSFGNGGLARRLVYVARGTSDHNATNVGQLKDSLATLGGGAGMDGNGNVVAPTYAIQGSSHHTVGDALAALDGAVITSESRVEHVEEKLRSVFQDNSTLRTDGVNQITLAGANGAVLTNLADGRIAAGSRDAVTGSQLYAAKQDIARNRNDIEQMKESGGAPASQSKMAVLGSNNNIVDFGGSRLSGVEAGDITSASSTDVVIGGQLFVTNVEVKRHSELLRFSKIGWDDLSLEASAGWFGVAIGESAEATPQAGHEGGTAIGSFSKAFGTNSVALGRAAHVLGGATQGFALGASSRVDVEGGVALGAGSQVKLGAMNGVALGYGSYVDEENVVSVGNASLKRRISNVARGTAEHDAATIGQLRGTLSSLGGSIDSNGDVIAPTFNVQGHSQATVGDALTALDGAVVTTGSRMDRVEGQLRSVFQDAPSARADGLNQLTFAGANGMVLSNVGNGLIAAGSRDAVNGGQLHSMQQQLNGRMDGLEQRMDGQPQALQSRALTVATADTGTVSGTPAATPAADEPTAPPPSSSDNKVVADAGNAPKSSPQPKADAPQPEAPTPQVDTADLEKMLARANEYTDGISREVDRRLDKMDKRFNRMAAMGSAQSAMAMNTAGLNTYNRLGAGVGYSEGESAMAVGYQRVLNDKGSATFSLNGAFTNSGERTVGVGVGIGW